MLYENFTYSLHVACGHCVRLQHDIQEIYQRNTYIQLSSVGLTHTCPNHIGMIITERSTMLHDNLPSTACIIYTKFFILSVTFLVVLTL